MDLLEAIILGIVQGLTEFLPISSSAHLVIVPWLFGWNSPLLTSLTFDVALHLGTLVAVLVYFIRDWILLIRGFIASLTSEPRFVDKEPERRLSWFILLGSIPAAIVGVLGESKINDAFHSADPKTMASGIMIIAIVMIIMAGALYLAERIASHRLQLKDITFPMAIIIGCAQALALIPGVSRSGSTITAGLFLNLRREDAARYSFLLGTPAIVGAGIKSVYDLLKDSTPISSDALMTMLAGFIAAAIVGFATIVLLLRFLQRNSTIPFVVYRVVVGVLLILLVLVGFRQ